MYVKTFFASFLGSNILPLEYSSFSFETHYIFHCVRVEPSISLRPKPSIMDQRNARESVFYPNL